MPLDNGIWTKEEAEQHHAFDYFLARWIGKTLYGADLIYDFGCGPGHYVEYLNDIGRRAIGFEGSPSLSKDYVLLQNLAVPFRTIDHAHVICLEVGEHIPEQFLPVFLDNITRPLPINGLLILSWAVPGQEGIGHVSCRTNEWVRKEMALRGLKFRDDLTTEARLNTSNHCAYFRDTLMVFQR